MNFKSILFLIFPLFLFVSNISAEKKLFEQEDKVRIGNSQNIDLESQRKIMFARKQISNKNYEGAASFLEVLYETDQTNPLIVNLLKRCYSQLKLHFKLEELIKKQIESHKDNIGFWLSYAEVVAIQGRKDEALNHYKSAVSLINGTNRLRYQLIIQSMLKFNLESEAEHFILSWREESKNNNLLGDQMGVIFERNKEYEKAMAEYYPVLDDTTQIGNKIEKEIVELLLFEDSSPIAEKYLLEQNKKTINVRAVKILSMHYIRTGQLEKSFRFTILRDSLSEKNGNSLISYMQTCQREKLYEETIRMGEYLLTQYKNLPTQNRARFLIGDAYKNNSQFAKSMLTYNTIFENSKSGRDRADALYFTAKIYQYELGDLDSALIYLDSLTTYYKSGISYMNGLVDIPYCYLQKGELEKAKILYLDLETKRLNVDTKEKVLYHLAQTYLIENKSDSCKTLLSKILIKYPNGFYVNDALSLLRIIQTGSDTPIVLKDYSKVILFEIQNQNDSTIVLLNKIVQDASKVLADFALFKLSETHLTLDDTTQVLETIDQMEKNFPDSYYYPFSLKQKADILLSQNKKAVEAYKIYRQLLLEFPNYPFITEVRKILRSSSEDQSNQNS